MEDAAEERRISDEFSNELLIREIFKTGEKQTLYKGLWFPAVVPEGDSGLEELPRASEPKPDPQAGLPVLVKQVFLHRENFNLEELLKQIPIIMGVVHASFVNVHACVQNNSFCKEAILPNIYLLNGMINEGEPLDPYTHFILSTNIPSVYIIESFVDGCDLRQAIRETPGKGMKESEMAAIAFDVLRGLKYLHSGCHVIHRNITTKNLLLDKLQGRIRIAHLENCAELVDLQNGRFEFSGSIGHIAPEIFATGSSDFLAGVTHAYSYSVDVWAFGMCVLEMALGIFSTSNNATFNSCLHKLSTMPCSCQPNLIPENDPFDIKTVIKNDNLVDFLACCFRRDPSKRPECNALLRHPFLVEQRMQSLMERTRAIAGIASRVKQSVVDSATNSALRKPSSSKPLSSINSNEPSTPRTVGYRLSVLSQGAEMESPVPPELQSVLSQVSSNDGRKQEQTVRQLEEIFYSANLSPFTNDGRAKKAEFTFNIPPELKGKLISDEKPSHVSTNSPNTDSFTVLEAVEETLESLVSLHRAIQLITPDVWHAMEVAGVQPYAQEDYYAAVQEASALKATLEHLRDTIQKLSEAHPYFSYTFCHCFTRHFFVTPPAAKGLQTVADCFEYLNRMDRKEEEQKNASDTRANQSLDPAEKKKAKPSFPSMPVVVREGGSSAASRPMGNASSFLYNKWLKDMEKGK
ncbi:Protein tyrosine kinase/Protein kinase domain containing protein, putative [Angomonas deanei]|uniref:Protein tyrosine kinase/Protein kinase domain containing protein, putative n=1 Tax=Angomonas deanei TaxID=59799 RepID=A0A7G2CAD9_9TRYP|nr:Protein tyrosine kinase/Protein kinase domain containing protein, putative [Angomonas deanei]